MSVRSLPTTVRRSHGFGRNGYFPTTCWIGKKRGERSTPGSSAVPRRTIGVPKPRPIGSVGWRYFSLRPGYIDVNVAHEMQVSLQLPWPVNHDMRPVIPSFVHELSSPFRSSRPNGRPVRTGESIRFRSPESTVRSPRVPCMSPIRPRNHPIPESVSPPSYRPVRRRSSAVRSRPVLGLQPLQNVTAFKSIYVAVQIGVSIVIATYISLVPRLRSAFCGGNSTAYDARASGQSCVARQINEANL